MVRMLLLPAPGEEPVARLATPASLAGVCVLAPGESFPNHYHRHHDELFVPLRGAAELWTDCRHRHLLEPGVLARCDPGEMHYLVNTGTVPFVTYFVKTAGYPDDRIDVAWQPGMPPPPDDPGSVGTAGA